MLNANDAITLYNSSTTNDEDLTEWSINRALEILDEQVKYNAKHERTYIDIVRNVSKKVNIKVFIHEIRRELKTCGYKCINISKEHWGTNYQVRFRFRWGK